MAAGKFGGQTTWLKGHRTGEHTPFVYFDLYKCEAIRKENEDDYTIWVNGKMIELVDCVVLDDLEKIKPPPG